MHVVADTPSATLLVTDRRVVVAQEDRVALDISFDALRRIQFDVERRRPATLVIVPEHPADEPQVLAIPPERYEAIAAALDGHRAGAVRLSRDPEARRSANREPRGRRTPVTRPRRKVR